MITAMLLAFALNTAPAPESIRATCPTGEWSVRQTKTECRYYCRATRVTIIVPHATAVKAAWLKGTTPGNDSAEWIR